MYDSPKQIRRRQQRAENKPARRYTKTKTDFNQDWNATCDFHVGRIRAHIKIGYAESAYRHAEALAHMARQLYKAEFLEAA